MKVTEKDKAFLESLRQLMDSKDIWVDLRSGKPSSMILRGTYGERIHRVFHMSRQGVRWRFWHVFNDMYVSAFETILFIERNFGTALRDHAIRISKERYGLRQERQVVFRSATTLMPRSETGDSTAAGRQSPSR